MFKEKIYPYLLSTVQLGSLAFLGHSAPVISKSWDGILPESAGIFLALHAIFVTGVHNVNITPTPKAGAILITGGPYRLIRHPYTWHRLFCAYSFGQRLFQHTPA